ncbi:TNT domain-containing protein [Mariniflexile sp.]|uniref:TNT domain-containing protein n=1 Tax=Mariniflexile sp. TaxID=1979402 RepID=UPI0040472DA8
MGAVGGGYSGLQAAKASGSGIWFGTEAKPSATVIAGNVNKAIEKAQVDYDKSTQVQAEPTTQTNTVAKYYPENDGAVSGTLETKYLYEGDMFDRIGTLTERSNYVSPIDTPKSLRFLPSNNDGVYSAYQVLKPFPVLSSQIAPFGGIQYQTPLPLTTLISKGIIIRTK